MAFHVRDAETDTLVRKLAQVSGLGITEAIKTAVANEIRRRGDEEPVEVKVQRLIDRVAAHRTGPLPKSDKKFFDDLYED